MSPSLELVVQCTGLPHLLENAEESLIYFSKFPGPGKCWKMTLVLESPGN